MVWRTAVATQTEKSRKFGFIHTCEMTDSYVDGMTWCIHVYFWHMQMVWRGSGICETWLLHMLDVMHSCVLLQHTQMVWRMAVATETGKSWNSLRRLMRCLTLMDEFRMMWHMWMNHDTHRSDSQICNMPHQCDMTHLNCPWLVCVTWLICKSWNSLRRLMRCLTHMDESWTMWHMWMNRDTNRSDSQICDMTPVCDMTHLKWSWLICATWLVSKSWNTLRRLMRCCTIMDEWWIMWHMWMHMCHIITHVIARVSHNHSRVSTHVEVTLKFVILLICVTWLIWTNPGAYVWRDSFPSPETGCSGYWGVSHVWINDELRDKYERIVTHTEVSLKCVTGGGYD